MHKIALNVDFFNAMNFSDGFGDALDCDHAPLVSFHRHGGINNDEVANLETWTCTIVENMQCVSLAAGSYNIRSGNFIPSVHELYLVAGDR